jgi:exodeoxyribonuclease-3
MLRLISINVNGIRSAAAKGLYPWLSRQRADVVCLQELKAHEMDVPRAFAAGRGFRAHFSCAAKKGYSGVAVLSRVPPQQVTCGFGSREFDGEGRYIQADYDGLSVVSVYFPSGSSSPERQQAKYRFLDEFEPVLKRLRRGAREVVLCGDINIAHQPIDLKNWRSNQKNSGFLPEERAWLTRLLDRQGWVDVYRRLYPTAGEEAYTWWSTRGQAWAKNVGWRIDLQISTPGLAQRAAAASVYKRRRFSDHAPLTVDYDWDLGLRS